MNHFLTKCINLIFSLTFLMCGSTLAQFTADMLQTEEGVTKTSKLYFEEPFYRMDVEEDGEKMFVVVDQKNKVTRVIRPSEKMYIEMGSQSMMSMANDVFQSIDNMKETYDAALVGTETINGFECAKYIISFEGKEMVTYWQSSELGYPIKVINTMANGMTMELNNIQEGDVDDSLFKIPEGYTKMEMPAR